MKTWFDKYIFDRPYHRLLKQCHPGSTVPYTLPVNTYLFIFGPTPFTVALVWWWNS